MDTWSGSPKKNNFFIVNNDVLLLTAENGINEKEYLLKETDDDKTATVDNQFWIADTLEH